MNSVQHLFCLKRVKPRVLHYLNVEFGIEPFPAKPLGFFMFGMITPLLMRFQRFKFNNGNTFTVRCNEGFDGDKTWYLLG